MKLITAISWANSISPTTLHHPQTFCVWNFRKMSTFCVSSGSDFGATQKTDDMIVSITGATGFVDNHHVRVLTRSRSKALQVFPEGDFPRIIIAEEPEWRNCIQGSTAVVNLAGQPVIARWSPDIVDYINNSADELRPKVLISATGIGYYGSNETQVLDEQSPSGNDYLAEVCREWEAVALRVNKDVRLALMRIGVVLGKESGALAKMIPLFKMFAGGPLGSGKQWCSWIHVDDVVNLICEALSNPSYKGVVNGTAPNPVRQSEMCHELGSILGRPSWLHVPEFAVKTLLGEGAYVVLQGQRVLPTKAMELGFPFKYPYIKDALRAILSS